MQISNETKIGALTIVSVTLLILGYNFLKGKDLTKKSDAIYAKFTDVGALEISSPVKIKGFRVGNVYKIRNLDKAVSEVVVMINLQEEVWIPVNSVAIISNSLTGTSTINIVPGNAKEYLKAGDTLQTSNNPDLLGKVMSSLDPILISAQKTVDTLQRVLANINSLFDAGTKQNLKASVANLEKTTSNLTALLDSENGSLAKTLSNAESFTANLNANKDQLNATVSNLQKASEKMAALELQTTINELNGSMSQLKTILEKANQKDGTLGLFLNDPALYNSLQQTSRSLNILIDDLKTNPKRYIGFSVFGKKDKSKPLSAPLADSTRSNK
jgi:phospholipid/cholesterol/gamma-HCH transport system substrate-binding protein